MENVTKFTETLRQGGAKKYHEKLPEQKKQFCRTRIEKLIDKGSFVEDGLFANCKSPDLAADGVVTGYAKIAGRKVALMANDSTVKAGSWGWRTVEKILRIQENAAKHQLPLFYLVDSAGARITDQVEMFPGRRGAGRIFYNQANLSGKVPQICLLFGPSAAGGAYMPAFCDVLIMVDGNASMYLGSPRMAEMVIGEKVTLEEMGGAKMHCSVSGSGDYLAPDEDSAIDLAKKYFSYFPQNSGALPERLKTVDAEPVDLKAVIPESHTKTYNMKEVIKAVVDKNTFFEIKQNYAKEVITGWCRIGGHSVGIVANQPMVKGGVLFVDSSDKVARFAQICSTYNIPLLFLSDIPGYMIGSKIEREGMIRAGAKLIYAMSNARVPKISVLVRKAYGAGLYAMAGPAFESECVLALPTAQMAVMGPEPAVNAVYFNKMAEMDEETRKKFRAEKIKEYEADIDLFRLAGELILDHIVDFNELRSELVNRFEVYALEKPREKQAPGILPM